MSSLKDKIQQLRDRTRTESEKEGADAEKTENKQQGAQKTDRPQKRKKPSTRSKISHLKKSRKTRPSPRKLSRKKPSKKKAGAGEKKKETTPGPEEKPEPTFRVERQPISLPPDKYDDLKVRIMDQLYEILDPTAMGELEQHEVRSHIRRHAKKLLAESEVTFNRQEEKRAVQEIVDDMTGYGPLEPLLDDKSISEILVNGARMIYVEKDGKLQLTDVEFRDNDHVLQVIDRIVRHVGRHVDESTPMCDARLPDGSRVNTIIPPLAIDYPSLSIRKFRTDVLGMKELVNDFGSFTDEIAVVLQACVKARLNILISGGTGSGKTTLLNVLSGGIPMNERIVTIEDSAELQLRQPHVVRLETRPPNIEGEGEVTQYDLLKNSLRMRPDRIILGEVRGREALDMLQAMNTGHEGSMSTIHANTPRDAISRMETMIAMGGLDLPQHAMRRQMASAIDLIVQVNRFADGSRKLTSFSEVMGMEGETITMQDIFVYEQHGFDDKGGVSGKHVATGVQPRFMQRLRAAGFEIPGAVFLPESTVEHEPGMLRDAKVQLGANKSGMDPDVEYHAERASVSMPAEQYDKIKSDIQRRLYDEMNPAVLTDLDEDKMAAHIKEAISKLLTDSHLSLNRREREQLKVDVAAEMMGFGPLEPLLKDAEVSDILVNGADQTYVEVGGKLRLTDVHFNDNDHLMHVIDRIVTSMGRHVDEGSPMCDARLPDGSRVNTIIPPLAVDYPSLSIRKFKTDALSIDDLINRFNSMSRQMGTLLQACVKGQLNMLISGGTGAGKTTLLNILSDFIPKDERIVTIEDSAELQLQQPHVVRLETRPANIEGKGEVNQYDLLRNSLRMRPDRIILGEVRGEEALDMLQAMNTGHEGSMSTIHANTPRDAISRMETMIAMGGMELPQVAMRQQIASAIDVIIQGNRFSDGTRKQTFISEVLGMEGETVTMQDLFVFERKGIAEDGTVLGEFVPTGVQPRFLSKLEATGIKLPTDLFVRSKES